VFEQLSLSIGLILIRQLGETFLQYRERPFAVEDVFRGNLRELFSLVSLFR